MHEIEFGEGKVTRLIRPAVEELGFDLRRDVQGPVEALLSGIPSELDGLLNVVDVLLNKLSPGALHELAPGEVSFKVNAQQLGILKLALQRSVLEERRKLEALQERTDLPEMPQRQRDQIQEMVHVYQRLPKGEALAMPSLAEFLNIGTVEQVLRKEGRELAPRVRDEKFHTLMAPSLFIGDLSYLREQCAFRRRPVAVAFLDIDDFKAFNTALSETVVDTEVLPKVMRCIEAWVYGRGFAYRQGGDEYLAIIPNVQDKFAVALCEELQSDLKDLPLPERAPQAVTISIGLRVVQPREMVTEHEIRQDANDAKQRAKEAGKDRVELAPAREI